MSVYQKFIPQMKDETSPLKYIIYLIDACNIFDIVYTHSSLISCIIITSLNFDGFLLVAICKIRLAFQVRMEIKMNITASTSIFINIDQVFSHHFAKQQRVKTQQTLFAVILQVNSS